MTSFLLLIGVSLFAVIGLIKLRYSHKGVNLLDLVAIILASLLCLTALLGYRAASQQSAAMLKCFIVAIVTITCVLIVIDILAFTRSDIIRELLTKLWTNLNDHGRIEFQEIFTCCDVTGNNTTSHYQSSYDVSCYLHNSDSRNEDHVVSDSLKRRQDCVEGFVGFLHTYMGHISATIGAIVVYNAIIVFLSAMLVVDTRKYVFNDGGKDYTSFPAVTDVILWRRRSSRRSTQAVESGIFELPPVYPTGPVIQTYSNSIDKSLTYR